MPAHPGLLVPGQGGWLVAPCIRLQEAGSVPEQPLACPWETPARDHHQKTPR